MLNVFPSVKLKQTAAPTLDCWTKLEGQSKQNRPATFVNLATAASTVVVSTAICPNVTFLLFLLSIF